VLVVSVFGIDMLDVSVFMAVSAGAVVGGVVV
jgi:hypothetical protein